VKIADVGQAILPAGGLSSRPGGLKGRLQALALSWVMQSCLQA